MNESIPEHREIREMLGAYALGGLSEQLKASLGAHLDGCPACREDLAEIAPLADMLRWVDPDALSVLPSPPPDLGERIAGRIAEERALTQARAGRLLRRSAARRRTRQVLTAAAAAVLLVTALGVGSLLDRGGNTAVVARPSAAALPVEDIALRALVPSIGINKAVVVAHTWGVEARFQATGLTAGQVYRASFRAADGRLLPAGEFLGVGATPLKCNMQAALLRADTIGFVVNDASGRTVLAADL